MGAIESLMRKFEEDDKTAGGVEEESSGTANDEESAFEDAENSVSDSDETESKSVKEEADRSGDKSQGEDGYCGEDAAERLDDKPKPETSSDAKRGCKRKNPTSSGPVSAAVEGRDRKGQRATDDGYVSPSSPLHVRSDNELQ